MTSATPGTDRACALGKAVPGSAEMATQIRHSTDQASRARRQLRARQPAMRSREPVMRSRKEARGARWRQAMTSMVPPRLVGTYPEGAPAHLIRPRPTELPSDVSRYIVLVLGIPRS